MSERNAKGLAPATGPATGQLDMVSRAAVIEMLRQGRRTYHLPGTIEKLEGIFDDLIERAKQL